MRGSLEKVGNHTYGFEKLHVWQNARRLVAQVYKVKKKEGQILNLAEKDEHRIPLKVDS